MRITTKDIAKLAGVSRGTVDRALNNRGNIAQDVKERILKIAEKHGYKKNILASNLARNKRIKIAVVIPDPSLDDFWKSPYDGIQSTQDYVQNYGIQLSFYLFNLLDIDSFSNSFEKAIKDKPDALLVAPVFLKESLLYFQIAKQNEIPFVCINSEIDNNDIMSYVGQNSFQCGLLAGKLFNFSKVKRKKIIVLTLGHSAKNAIHINEKIEGLKEYNIENNCNFEIVDKVVVDFSNKEVIQNLTDEILEEKDEILGIFFTNSRAYKFLSDNQEFLEHGKHMLIIGFDLLDQNVSLLENGNIDFLLNQSPKKQGFFSVLNLFNYFIHNIDIPQKIYLPVDIIVKENYQQYILEDKMNLELVVGSY